MIPPGSYETRFERTLPHEPPLVWALVADTNRWDRASGLVPGSYKWEQPDPTNPRTRRRVAHARQLGVAVAWVEPPYEWVEGRMVRGQREFLSGPIETGGFVVDLEPRDGGTVVRATSWLKPRNALGTLVGTYLKAQFARALQRYVTAIEQVLAKARGALTPKDLGGGLLDRATSEPPAALARRALWSVETDAVTSGPSTPVREEDLAPRAARFAKSDVPAPLREKLVEFLRTRPDEEVAQVRPFALARAWGEDRRAVLRACLHAARAGLLDLRWQLNCPTCKVGSDEATSLGSMKGTAHCEACEVDFALDFAQHVEAVFRVNRAVRPIEPAVYCESSPWFRPHVYAQLRAPKRGDEARTLAATLPAGPLLVRVRRAGGPSSTLEVDAAAPPARLLVTVRDDALVARAEGRLAPGEATELRVTNDGSEEPVLSLERAGWSADVALGSVVATMPDFHDLFATEAPATGAELYVGSVTLLFSDLTGSTAMYERVGDARAFALVQEHFRLLTEATERHRGVVVKTMGDAVMASFEAPADALRASVEMIEATAREQGSSGLSVKLGIHEGPCLAVQANGRLDYFGTAVNVCARLQAKARGGEVVLLQSLAEQPGIAALLRERGFATRGFDAELKGIKSAQQLVAIEVLRDMDALAGVADG